MDTGWSARTLRTDVRNSCRMPSPSGPGPPDEPSDEQQLADLLEACLRVERALPGSAARIIETAPKHLQTDLQQLVALAQKLWSVHDRELAPAVRQDRRARLLNRLAPGFWQWLSRGPLGRRVSGALQTLSRSRGDRR